MAQVEVLLPKMGESVAEATIIKWLKEEGETVDADESIIEIATDKVDSEVPAPAEGVLLKRLCNEGDVVNVGDVIAIIGSEGDSAEPVAAPKAETAVVETETTVPTALASATATVTAELEKTSPSGKFYSPLVRSIAKEEGVSMTELETIPGSGKSGRVTKKDILGFIQDGGRVATPAPATAPKSAPKVVATTPSVSTDGNVEIIEMDRMRKLIANHMVNSMQTSPHVTSFAILLTRGE